MGLVEQVSEQMKDAQKSRDAARLAALRNIRAAFLHEMKKDGAETLDDGIAQGVLRRLAKQREESIEAFEKAGRGDRVDAERAEKSVIESFLPRLADEASPRPARARPRAPQRAPARVRACAGGSGATARSRSRRTSRAARGRGRSW